MTLEAFSEEIKKKLEREFAEAKVLLNDTSKNNGVVLKGVTIIQENENCSPHIYLNNYFKKYEEGMSMEEIMENIITCYKENRVGNFDIGNFQNYDLIKDKITCRLVNYEANKENLAEIPYTRYLDLARIYVVEDKNERMGSYSIRINESHMKMWGVQVEDLEKLTEKSKDGNLESLYEITKKSIINRIMQMEGIEEKEAERIAESMMPEADVRENVMYVATNSQKLYGANVILDKEFMKRAAEVVGGDMIIIPSSVHEILLMKMEDSISTDSIKDMICEVNERQVSAEEVLSNHPYIYRAETGVIESAA